MLFAGWPHIHHSTMALEMRHWDLRKDNDWTIHLYFTFFNEQFRGKHWHAHFAQAQAIGMHVLFNGPIILRVDSCNNTFLDFSCLIYAPILVKLLGKSGFQKSATTGPHVKSPSKKNVQEPRSTVVFDGIPKASQSPIRISPRSTRLPVAMSASKKTVVTVAFYDQGYSFKCLCHNGPVLRYYPFHTINMIVSEGFDGRPITRNPDSPNSSFNVFHQTGKILIRQFCMEQRNKLIYIYSKCWPQNGQPLFQCKNHWVFLGNVKSSYEHGGNCGIQKILSINPWKQFSTSQRIG